MKKTKKREKMSKKKLAPLTIIAIFAALCILCILCSIVAITGWRVYENWAIANYSPTLLPTPTSTPLSTPTPAFTITPVPTTSETDFLASLPHSITHIKFYEQDTPNGSLPLDQRNYTTIFNSATTKYILWELYLAHQPPGQEINFVIHADYYDAAGNLINQTEVDVTAKPNNEGEYISSGMGWESDSGTSPESLKWKNGTYTVVLSVKQQEIGRASFTVQ